MHDLLITNGMQALIINLTLKVINCLVHKVLCANATLLLIATYDKTTNIIIFLSIYQIDM